MPLPDDDIMANYHANQMRDLAKSTFGAHHLSVLFNVLMAFSALTFMFTEQPFLVMCALLFIVAGNTIFGIININRREQFNLSVSRYKHYDNH